MPSKPTEPTPDSTSPVSGEKNPFRTLWMHTYICMYSIVCTMQCNANQKVQLPHANIYALNLILFVVMFINSLFPQF